MMSTSFGDDDFVNIDNLLELQKEEKYSISVREMKNEEWGIDIELSEYSTWNR